MSQRQKDKKYVLREKERSKLPTHPQWHFHRLGRRMEISRSSSEKRFKRFGCSVVERVKSFYRALNSILRVEGRSDDMVLLRLLEAQCLPVVAYAIEVLHVADRDERRSLRVAYNTIYRKVFSYRRFESVTALQHAIGRQTWEEFVEKRQSRFMIRSRRWHDDSLVKSAMLMKDQSVPIPT